MSEGNTVHIIKKNESRARRMFVNAGIDGEKLDFT